MFALTIYTTGPQCMACKMTKKTLDKLDVIYKEINIKSDSNALAYVEDLGYSQAPVCIVEDGTGQNHWSGFRPDLIRKVLKTLDKS